MKYFVSLVRPVFERAVVQVEAESYSEAQERALEKAAGLPDTSWRGEYKPSQYAFHIERAADADDVPAWAREPDLTDMRYAILQADIDSGEGAFMPQPWMEGQSSLLLSDVGGDWAAELEEFRDTEVAEFRDELEKIRRETASEGSVVSFARYLFLRRLKDDDDADDD